MTDLEKEMQELDDWIEVNVFKRETTIHWRARRFTTDPAEAMAVLEKCIEKLNCKDISLNLREDDFYALSCTTPEGRWVATSSNTLTMAICLFAKALFS